VKWFYERSLLTSAPTIALFAHLVLVWSVGADLFDGAGVKTVRIEISERDIAQLRAAPRQAVSAKLRIDEGATEVVSVHLKGRGSFQTIDEKPSFTITRSSSPTKFHLNNSVEDPSYLKEKIGGEIFRAAGIPAPNVAHARVQLNDKELGLYVLKEGFTREFIERSFDAPVGPLYDIDEGSDVDQAMEQDLGDSGAGRKELKELAAAANEPDLDRRFERLKTILDTDQFLTFLAVEMLICHWDGYALSKNNFRVYFEPKRHRVQFLPAGLDQIFSKPDLSWKPPMAGLVAKALLETPEGRRNYDAKFRKLYESFAPEKISSRVQEVVAQLQPFLTRSETTAISEESEHLISNIRARKNALRKQLHEPAVTFPEFENGIAEISGWQPADEPAGGSLVEDESGLRIVASPKTSASWRKSVLLRPGHYTFSANVRASGVSLLPFGARHGAVLRVFGKDSQSAALLGTSEQRLSCGFEVEREREVILICELRARGGTVTFKKPVLLEIKPKK
jgi:spore coat protein H